ncbi:septum formation protein Maf [Methanococcoides orientis]|uniref:Maf family nucleotide pyrophosphatase n=1 Tax=Methanococcoides orientis TaxID=2822137 RepID=UPI001E2C0BF8|nr:Maf family nucleotide pyrophosphatase [Methanococcoides orientis]UGV41822.1 septum formation protein Maf [Methanococcoides orientis]
MRRIVLASASPRRKELLVQIIGNAFEVCVSSYDEAPQPGMDATELVVHHSLSKARDVAVKFDSGIIISADTVVLCEGKVLGKPHSPEDAKEMLSAISGKVVQAITGMTVLDVDSGSEVSVSEITDVKMKKMSSGEISSYVRSGEPLDKAGAFAIQGKGAILVESINGDFFNVVGLPLFKLAQILEGMGVHVFDIE